VKSRANALDHRWGLRFPLARKVEIVAGEGGKKRGVVENASISGAFIRTDAQLAVLAVIRVRPYDTDLLLSAQVTRLEPDGVGIEWMEPDPGLLETLRTPVPAPMLFGGSGIGAPGSSASYL
jgi:hypothetical protein